MRVDEDAYEVALATLERSRRARKSEANQADALNWAAVVHIRRTATFGPQVGFPYLLTGTEPLLREEAWDESFSTPISRTPTGAIYSQVLFDVFSDPAAARQHTVNAAFMIAAAERALRTTSAYTEPGEHAGEPDLEVALEQGRIGQGLREQLSVLREIVNDRVIIAAQRIYDNAELIAENYAQRHHQDRAGQPRTSPRRLFDLLASLDAAVNREGHQASTGLGSLWDTVLTLDTCDYDDYTVYDLRDRGGRSGSSAYFSLEVHPQGAGDCLFVMRWPTGSDANSLLLMFANSFARHDEQTIQLVVGTPVDVQEYDATLPLDLDEILDAVTEATDDPAVGVDRGDFRWFRMNGSAFDLYADVAAQMPHDPVVGVFANQLNPSHVTDLYQLSSARYLFAAWIQSALSHVADVLNDDADCVAD